MVPTVDSVRYQYVVNTLIKAKRPILMTGPVGTGKTSVMQSALENLNVKKWNVLTINMSAQVHSVFLFEYFFYQKFLFLELTYRELVI